MTIEGQLGMFIGLFIGNFLSGLFLYKSWKTGLFMGAIVIPVYIIVALIATKCFGFNLP